MVFVRTGSCGLDGAVTRHRHCAPTDRVARRLSSARAGDRPSSGMEAAASASVVKQAMRIRPERFLRGKTCRSNRVALPNAARDRGLKDTRHHTPTKKCGIASANQSPGNGLRRVRFCRARLPATYPTKTTTNARKRRARWRLCRMTRTQRLDTVGRVGRRYARSRHRGVPHALW